MKSKCTVNALEFNNGKQLDVSPNDIIVFVGPNNCGKSQSLKDIDKAFYDPKHNIVVTKVIYENDGIDSFEEELKKFYIYDSGDNRYKGFGKSIGAEFIKRFKKDSFGGMQSISRFFINQIDTRDRLQQCDPVDLVDRDEPKTHPLHYLVNNPAKRKQIDDSFSQAFGQHLQVDRVGGKTVSLRIGDKIDRLDDPNCSVDDDIDHLIQIMDSYPKLHEQGDGMIGFVGVMLSLLIEHFSVFLIDEPESFLHPPQAIVLGSVIPSLLGDRQAFISTHSEHLIKGLLDAAPNRIKVVRISRDGNTNHFSFINTEIVSKIWNDTLLKQSNILQGLFYDSVIICESDSDCQFYSSVHSSLNEIESKHDNSFYVYSSTKSRMKVIVEALRPLNVEFRVIADIDLLRDINDIRPLYEACGGEWHCLSGDYSIFSGVLKDENNTISKEKLKLLFADTIDKDGKTEYDKTSLQELKRKVTLEKKWDDLKKNGESAVPQDAKESFDRIKSFLTKQKIHLVPKGELERFISVGGHGPKWVAKVFDQYPDLSNGVFDDAKDFIRSLKL